MCGATGLQKSIGQAQFGFMNTMMGQAQQVFGDSSSVFNDLKSAFEPIVAAGPNQQGFSAAELTALNTQATEGTAQTYKKAAGALGASLAARGGGNTFVPSGEEQELRQELATSAAGNEAAAKNKIVQANYETGRENFFGAAKGLMEAPNAFNAATGFANAATGAGNAASNTANEIAAADNSWVNAAFGALGAVGGAAVTAGFNRPGSTGGSSSTTTGMTGNGVAEGWSAFPNEGYT